MSKTGCATSTYLIGEGVDWDQHSEISTQHPQTEYLLEESATGLSGLLASNDSSFSNMMGAIPFRLGWSVWLSTEISALQLLADRDMPMQLFQSRL
jgi:hypothetical protein